MIFHKVQLISFTLVLMVACSYSEYEYVRPAMPDNYYSLALEDSYDTTWVDREYSFICGLKGLDSIEFSQYTSYKTNIFRLVFQKEFYDSTGQRYKEDWYYRRRKLIKIKYYYLTPVDTTGSVSWFVTYAGKTRLKDLNKNIYLFEKE